MRDQPLMSFTEPLGDLRPQVGLFCPSNPCGIIIHPFHGARYATPIEIWCGIWAQKRHVHLISNKNLRFIPLVNRPSSFGSQPKVVLLIKTWPAASLASEKRAYLITAQCSSTFCWADICRSVSPGKQTVLSFRARGSPPLLENGDTIREWPTKDDLGQGPSRTLLLNILLIAM